VISTPRRRIAATGAVRASPRRAGRTVGFVATVFAFAVVLGGSNVPTPLYSIYRTEFDLSELDVTLVFGAYVLGTVFWLYLFGNASDTLGRRRVMLAGLAAALLSTTAYLLADGFLALLVARVLAGLAAGAFAGAATAAIVDLEPSGNTRRASLIATVSSMVPLGLGPAISGALAEYVADPLHAPFWLLLGALALATVGVLAMPEPVAGAESRRFRPRARQLRLPGAVLPVFLPAAIAGFAGFSLLGFFSATAPSIIGEVLGNSAPLAVGLVALSVFGGSAAGQLAQQRIEPVRALPLACKVLIVAMAVIALAVAEGSLALLFLGGIVGGCGQGLAFAAALSAVNQAAPPTHRAAVASSLFIACQLGLAIPVIGIGLLQAQTGATTASLVFAGAVAALAALSILGIRLTWPRPTG
jgi:MFS family permease